MNIEILHKLENILGSSVKSTKDERLFHCPFCNHHKHKLSINLGSKYGYWKCWVCGQSGKKLYYLLKHCGVSHQEIVSILNEDYYLNDPNESISSIKLYLPPEYIPLWSLKTSTFESNNALAFLKKRGLSGIDIARYRIGYCESGLYKNMIIIPSYTKDETLNYFVSRTYYDGDRKYKNPPISKNCVIFENMINWNLPVVLVEGAFDAISVRRNAIPLLGKFPSAQLFFNLIKNRPPIVYVMLDDDAYSEAIKIEHILRGEGLSVKLVILSDKDASEMGFEKSWNCINSSQESTFSDLIRSKL